MVKELQRCVPGRASQVDKPELLKDGMAEEQGEIYLVAACGEVGDLWCCNAWVSLCV